MSAKVQDIFDNEFSLYTANELPEGGVQCVIFRDTYFAEQFLQWLQVNDEFWLQNTGTCDRVTLAQLLVDGNYVFVPTENY